MAAEFILLPYRNAVFLPYFTVVN